MNPSFVQSEFFVKISKNYFKQKNIPTNLHRNFDRTLMFIFEYAPEQKCIQGIPFYIRVVQMGLKYFPAFGNPKIIPKTTYIWYT